MFLTQVWKVAACKYIPVFFIVQLLPLALHQKHNQANAPSTVQADDAVKVVPLAADDVVAPAAAAAVPLAGEPEPEPDAAVLCVGTPVVTTPVGTDDGV